MASNQASQVPLRAPAGGDGKAGQGPRAVSDAAPSVCPAAAEADGAEEEVPRSFGNLCQLHAGLILSQALWSIMHVIISVPLRRGASPVIVALYREFIGFLSLSAVAHVLEPPATRPPVDARLWRLIAACGLAFAVLRLTIMLALLNAGPAIVAALTPLTPVITLAFGLLAGTDQLDWRSRAGATQLGGMLLCTLSAGLLVPLRGPLLVGRVPVGDFAPSNAGLGVLFMLINCSTSSFTQLVNKRILSPPPGEGGGAVRAGALPLFSATAYVAGAATACLFPMALVLAPSPGQWVPTGWMVAACLYAGLFATALNNVMIGRANRALGPTVATFYMPLQPVLTVFLDYIAVNDAVYLGNLGCAAGVAAGLVAAVSGRHAGGRDRAAAAASAARRAPEGWWDEESDDEELLPRPGVAPLWTHAGGGGKG